MHKFVRWLLAHCTERRFYKKNRCLHDVRNRLYLFDIIPQLLWFDFLQSQDIDTWRLMHSIILVVPEL